MAFRIWGSCAHVSVNIPPDWPVDRRLAYLQSHEGIVCLHSISIWSQLGKTQVTNLFVTYGVLAGRHAVVFGIVLQLHDGVVLKHGNGKLDVRLGVLVARLANMLDCI